MLPVRQPRWAPVPSPRRSITLDPEAFGLARLTKYIPEPLVPGARRIYRALGRPGRGSNDSAHVRMERAAAKVEREAARAAQAAARVERAAARAEQAAAKAEQAAARAERAAATGTPPLSAAAPPRSRDELHAYWREPDKANRAEGYANPIERSAFLLELLEPFVSREDAILEISSKAVEAMRVTYPDLVPAVTIYNAPVEEVIRELPDLSFGAVFTMAVLEHIHPDSDWIFTEMVRICRGVIVTIEDEESQTWRHVPRDYRSIFEGLGMIQVREGDPSAIPGFGNKFRARVLQRAGTA